MQSEITDFFKSVSANTANKNKNIINKKSNIYLESLKEQLSKINGVNGDEVDVQNSEVKYIHFLICLNIKSYLFQLKQNDHRNESTQQIPDIEVDMILQLQSINRNENGFERNDTLNVRSFFMEFFFSLVFLCINFNFCYFLLGKNYSLE